MNGRARKTVESLYRAARAAVDPAAGVRKSLKDPSIRRTLADARSVGVFAVGKAAARMIRGARGRFDRGLAILPRGYPPPAGRGLEILFAAHPEPDRASVRAAKRALGFFREFGREDVILCLVSGGASSLLCLPRSGVTLAQLRRAVSRLARRGTSILELNRLRTSLSAVKGGKLGRTTAARIVTLVLSDVPGDRPSAIGSGPTIRGKRGDLVRVVGSNRKGLAAAAGEARRRGLRARVAGRRLSGEAREAGARFGRRAATLGRNEALLAGGETTVTLPKRTGRGGRSLEFALAAGLELGHAPGVSILAAASDGRDGSSPAAGAFADSGTAERARRSGRDPRRALDRHDTHALFAASDDLFVTGPTGTNVADWAFAVRRLR